MQKLADFAELKQKAWLHNGWKLSVIFLAILIGLTLWLKSQSSDLTKITVGSKIYLVEVVDTPQLRSKGLSGRQSLKPNHGMLFKFDSPNIPEFVMRDMNFPIDIIWIRSDMTVIGAEENVLPETYPGETFSPPQPVLYVLEVNAGSGVLIGDTLTGI